MDLLLRIFHHWQMVRLLVTHCFLNRGFIHQSRSFVQQLAVGVGRDLVIHVVLS